MLCGSRALPAPFARCLGTPRRPLRSLRGNPPAPPVGALPQTPHSALARGCAHAVRPLGALVCEVAFSRQGLRYAVSGCRPRPLTASPFYVLIIPRVPRIHNTLVGCIEIFQSLGVNKVTVFDIIKVKLLVYILEHSTESDETAFI